MEDGPHPQSVAMTDLSSTNQWSCHVLILVLHSICFFPEPTHWDWCAKVTIIGMLIKPPTPTVHTHTHTHAHSTYAFEGLRSCKVIGLSIHTHENTHTCMCRVTRLLCEVLGVTEPKKSNLRLDENEFLPRQESRFSKSTSGSKKAW